MLDAGDACDAGRSPRSLSREYRAALRDCMAGWEEEMMLGSGSGSGSGSGPPSPADGQNLELLKVSAALLHLSELYLLPRDGASVHGPLGGMGGPGSLTAGTVRYLRLNHLPDVYDAVGASAAEVEELQASDQPEHLLTPGRDGNDDGDGDGDGGEGEGGALFWSLVEAYAARGCLRDVWALLTHHSAVRRASAWAARQDGRGERGTAADAVLREDAEALEILRGMLLGAPLPGGIDDAGDAGLDDDDGEGQDGMEVEEDDGLRLVPGVPRRAWELWDDDDDDGAPPSAGGSDGLPAAFHPRAAAARHRTWSAAVGKALSPAGPLSSLLRRIPRLRRLLSILRGRFDDVEAGGGAVPLFRTWDEALCAELLYVMPTVRPDDVHVRAELAMARFGLSVGSAGAGGSSADSAVEEIILSVMRGDAGRAVISLQGFGGSSGAALPAAMVSGGWAGGIAGCCRLRIARCATASHHHQQPHHFSLSLLSLL
jgi:hypothetical protein